MGKKESNIWGESRNALEGRREEEERLLGLSLSLSGEEEGRRHLFSPPPPPFRRRRIPPPPPPPKREGPHTSPAVTLYSLPWVGGMLEEGRRRQQGDWGREGKWLLFSCEMILRHHLLLASQPLSDARRPHQVCTEAVVDAVLYQKS